MSTTQTSAYKYKVGGSLEIDAPSYVKRQADEDFYHELKAGEFCYVLNSRQMGKSSLRVQTMRRLQEDHIACGVIDVTAIGSQDITPAEWYLGVLRRLVRSFTPKVKALTWWRNYEGLAPVQRLSEFIEEVLLAEISQNIVIFIDEIDSVLKLNFKDDFFALIRACYNKRADNPAYQRLTFALLGVATPSDLIQDKNRTPFNIGHSIQLNGFKFGEAQPLVQGLAGRVSNPQAVLKEVLAWTGGQPFLTQKLCNLVFTASSPMPAGSEAKQIEDLVRLVIEQDDPEHLKTIRDRILRSEQRAVRLLGLYRQILQQGEVVADGSPEQMELRLSGLVVEEQGKLRVYNRIYRSVFDKVWADKELENLRSYAEVLGAWVASNCQDESRLLRGQALQDAQAWAAGKSLNPLDYQFLSDSYKREANQFLTEAQQKTKLALEEEKKANQRLTETQQKTNQTIRTGVVALAALSLVGATVATGLVNNANHKLAFAQSELQKTTSKNTDLETANRAAGQKLQVVTQDRQSAEKQANQAKQVQQQAQAAREKAEQKAQQINLDLAFAQSELQKTTSKNTDLETANRAAGQKLQVATQQRQSAEEQTQQAKQVQQRAEIRAKEVANRAKQENIIALNLRSEGLLLLNDQLRALVASVKAGRQLLTTGAPSEIWKQTVSTLQQAVCGTQECRVQERNRLEGHEDWISGVSFSPDGQMIASASRDQTVKLWSRDGRLLKTLKGHGNWLHNSVSFSPDGQTIASASNKNTIKLLSREGTLLKTLNGHSSFVESVSFSPNGQTIASASNDKTIKLWSRDGKLLITLEGHTAGVRDMRFSPDGQTIASASRDRTIKLWRSQDGKLLKTIVGHSAGVNSVSFSSDGQTIASASYDNTVKLWSREGTLLKTLGGHTSGVMSVSFSPDGQTIASASDDKTIKLWSREGTLLKTLKGHREEQIYSISFSPDGQTLASAGADNIIRLWRSDHALLKSLQEHTGGVQEVSFSPDGQLIASASDDKTIKLWSRNGTLLKTLEGHSAEVMSVSFSPDSQTIVSASRDKTIKLWNRDGHLKTLEGHSADVESVSFSPDGLTIASASNDNTVKLWSRDGTSLKTFRGHRAEVRSVSFSTDSQTLASASADKTIKLWSRDGTLLKTLKGHREEVYSVSFSPDGLTIASTSRDHTIKLWSRDGTLLKTLDGHSDWVFEVGFSPNSQIIASAGADSTIKLWSRDGTLLKTLDGHSGWVESVSFSPDSQTIASASADGTVKLWKGMTELPPSNLDNLLVSGCSLLHDYLKNNPNMEKRDHRICDNL